MSSERHRANTKRNPANESFLSNTNTMGARKVTMRSAVNQDGEASRVKDSRNHQNKLIKETHLAKNMIEESLRNRIKSLGDIYLQCHMPMPAQVKIIDNFQGESNTSMNTPAWNEAKLSSGKNVTNEFSKASGNNLRENFVDKIFHNNRLKISDTNRVINLRDESDRARVKTIRQFKGDEDVKDGILNIRRDNVPARVIKRSPKTIGTRRAIRIQSKNSLPSFIQRRNNCEQGVLFGRDRIPVEGI